jgi:hypothetical protein
MYSDDTRECQQPVPLGDAPFGGPAEAEGQTTARDEWGVQPKPGYPSVGYRDLVENGEQREADVDSDEPDDSDGDANPDG